MLRSSTNRTVRSHFGLQVGSTHSFLHSETTRFCVAMASVHIRIYAENDEGVFLLRCKMPSDVKLRVAMHAWYQHFNIAIGEAHFVFNQRVLSEHATPWELSVRTLGHELNIVAVPRLDDPGHDVLQVQTPAVCSVLSYVADVPDATIEDFIEDSDIIDALRLG